MNFTPTNSVQVVIPGDIEHLTGPMAWLSITLEDDELFVLSGDDLVCSFYLFELPVSWTPLFAFSKTVPRGFIDGSDSLEPLWVGSAVVGTGWCNAVGLIQHAMRRVATRAIPHGAGLPLDREVNKSGFFPDREQGKTQRLWSIYLDDANLIRILNVWSGNNSEANVFVAMICKPPSGEHLSSGRFLSLTGKLNMMN